ncbi:hypothetical protein HAX54_022233, partial [Datura stramonium]|nr:hypothetical protein [Datura stramonium]
WDIERLQDHLPVGIVDHVLRSLKMGSPSTTPLNPCWIKTNLGKYTMGSVWESIRQRGLHWEEYNKTWTKEVTYRISFLLWRIWTLEIPIDDILKHLNIYLV